MRLNTIQEIERAIDALTPEELGELYSWLSAIRSPLMLAYNPTWRPAVWTHTCTFR